MGKIGKQKARTPNPTNTSGLRPIRDHETAVRLGRKGGLANKNNPNQQIAAKLRALKRKGLSDENVAHLHEVITEHELSALDIRLFLESCKKDVKSARDKTDLSRCFIEWHKMHHGVVQKNLNLNVNIDVDVSEVEDHLKTVLGGGE